MTKFMTDPDSMQEMAPRFEQFSLMVSDSRNKMMSSANNIAGAGWGGPAQAASLDSVTEMNKAFARIEQLLGDTSSGLHQNASNYEIQEQQSQQNMRA